MHTVFINDRRLRFVSFYDKQEIESAKNSEVYSEKDKTIAALISQLENEKKHAEVFYLSADSDTSWKIFISNCTLIEAAGGLVQNDADEFLLIFRHHTWDLPKGKIEFDETPEQAAIREVEEECGIKNLAIIQKLPHSFHTYKLNEKRMLKKNHWFLMQTVNKAPLVPQTNEGIEEARWMNKNSMQTIALKNMHASIAGLLNQFFGWS